MMPVRDRATAVCIECHARKVKCDLQTSADGVCKNCRHSRQTCIERSGARKRRTVARPRKRAGRVNQPQEPLGQELYPQNPATSHSAVAQSDGLANTPSLRSNGFVSHCSKLYYGKLADAVTFDETSSVTSSHLRDTLLGSIQADSPPRPVLFRAWADAFMTQAVHHCPVLEPKDISDSPPSIVLQKGICIVANLMRHDASGPKLAAELYERVKILTSMNCELDLVQTLKTICLLSLWSSRPSNPVSLDGPWHWTGVGTRLALQMGLHRETTLLNRPDAGCLRRIFWQLHNSDSLHIACWGHPSLLRRQDFDVKLPTLDDFEIQNIQSLVFIESTKLCTIINRISELQAERRRVRPEELTSIKIALCDWLDLLPEDLRLYDANGGRNTYYRPASELAIQYFVAVILGEFLWYKEKLKSCHALVPSLLAASCAATLYDEIHCRDESVFLPHIHGFFCLVFALPLIHYVPQPSLKEATCKNDLGVLRSILTRLSDRYGDGKMALRMIDDLEKNVERTARPYEDGDSMEEPATGLCFDVNRLFPFPPTLCDNMDLLKPTAAPEDQFVVNNLVPMQTLPADDANFDFTWMDLFGLDFGDANVEF